MRGLQRGDRRQHRQHFPGAVRIGACPLAHGAPVTLHEQHDGGLRRLVGVLPDPGAVGVARAEGAGHGVAEGPGVEGPAGFEHGEQGPGGVEECRGAVGGGARGAGGRDWIRGEAAGARTHPAPGGRRAWVSPDWCAWNRRSRRGWLLPRRLAGPAPGRLPRLGMARSGNARDQAGTALRRPAVRARPGAMGRGLPARTSAGSVCGAPSGMLPEPSRRGCRPSRARQRTRRPRREDWLRGPATSR